MPFTIIESSFSHRGTTSLTILWCRDMFFFTVSVTREENTTLQLDLVYTNGIEIYQIIVIVFVYASSRPPFRKIYLHVVGSWDLQLGFLAIIMISVALLFAFVLTYEYVIYITVPSLRTAELHWLPCTTMRMPTMDRQ